MKGVEMHRQRVSIVSAHCLRCDWKEDPNKARPTLLRAAKRHAAECSYRGKVVVDSEQTTSYQRIS